MSEGPQFQPGDRIRSELMSWKHGVVTKDKKGKFYREGNSGPSMYVQMDDRNGLKEWWAARDLLPDVSE